MQKIDNKHFIWAEKYRPQTLTDMILPSDVLTKFQEFKEQGQIPNLLLCSTTPGLGKSSIATAIIKDLEADSLWINCSRDGNIDTARNKITNFATNASFTDAPKIVIMDESDGLSSSTGGAQQALRGIIEEFSKNTRFIFTANYPDKLIEPIRNRLVTFDFDNMFHKNKKELGTQIFKRLTFILENEGIKYEKEQLQKVILTYYPSVRKMIMVLQQNSTSGKLEISDRILNENIVVEEIIEALKKKDFSKMRSLLNELSDPEHLFSMIYSKIDKIVTEKSIPVVIMTTAKYLDMSQRSRDKYITLAAYCAELCLSQQIEFKG